MKELNMDEFKQEVLSANSGDVIVDFYASWCGPCQMQSPILEQFADANPTVKVFKVNTDDAEDIAAMYQVMTIPTLMAFKNGELINRAVGVQNVTALKNMLG